MLITRKGFFWSPAQASLPIFLMPTLGILNVRGSFVMKRKLILCFIYNHFTRFYEKQLEDEATHHKTGKELVGLIPALHRFPWPGIWWGVNQDYAGKQTFVSDSRASWKSWKATRKGAQGLWKMQQLCYLPNWESKICYQMSDSLHGFFLLSLGLTPKVWILKVWHMHILIDIPGFKHINSNKCSVLYENSKTCPRLNTHWWILVIF